MNAPSHDSLLAPPDSGRPLLRVGILGAARIAATAMVRPTHRVDKVTVRALAARDLGRAGDYARKHGIPVVHDSYEALLADPEIDAVYIPLPPALHGTWTLAALAAGKHVLCEKPFTANAAEAETVAAAARKSDLVVMEAHHTTFHPFTERIRHVIRSGVLGEVEDARAWFHSALPPGEDIRWNPRLGGGSLMDLGVYPVRMLRDVLGEPTVRRATARQRGGIDRRMTALLDIDGIPTTIDCGMWSAHPIGMGLEVTGSRGRLRVRSPYHPHLLGRLSVHARDARFSERADRTSSYIYQLTAFRDAIIAAGHNAAPASEAVHTMRTIDDIYTAAGMALRQPIDGF